MIRITLECDDIETVEDLTCYNCPLSIFHEGFNEYGELEMDEAWTNCMYNSSEDFNEVDRCEREEVRSKFCTLKVEDI